jgi:hypothetical protein
VSGRLANIVRIERTTRELEHLDAQITAWIDGRRSNDLLGQYQTPLAHLKKALCGSLAGLRTAVERIRPEDPADVIYPACRSFDYRLMLVHRVWTWYRAKFEQRDIDEFKPVLAAADEVIWSCYAAPFRVASQRSPDILRGPAPLAYIESRYAPEAIPRDEPPLDLRSDAGDAIVHDYLAKLAIPVVGIPPICLDNPWWLIYLGHEVGHHLQYDLVPDWALIDDFGELLVQTARTPPDPVLGQGAAERWRQWSREIFADACSVHAMGARAVIAMAELERSDEASMLARDRPRYPPAAVRLDMLARLAAGLGTPVALPAGTAADVLLEGSALMTGNVDLRQAAEQDRRMLGKITGAISDWSLGDVGGFRDLFGWNARGLTSYVDYWTAMLLSDEKLFPDMNLPAARMLAAATVAAWAQVAAIVDVKAREKARAQLAGRALKIIATSREEQTRAPDEAAMPDPRALADDLTALLLSAEPPNGSR